MDSAPLSALSAGDLGSESGKGALHATFRATVGLGLQVCFLLNMSDASSTSLILVVSSINFVLIQ